MIRLVDLCPLQDRAIESTDRRREVRGEEATGKIVAGFSVRGGERRRNVGVTIVAAKVRKPRPTD